MLKKKIYKAIGKPVLVELIFALLWTLCIALVPYVHKLLFDEGLQGGLAAVLRLVFLHIGLSLAGAVFQYISQRYEWKVEQCFQVAMKDLFFRRILHSRPSRYVELPTGEYISMLTNQLAALQEEYVDAIVDLWKAILQLLVYGVMLFVFVDYRIATVIFVASIGALVLPKLTAARLAGRKKEHLQWAGKYTARLEDFLQGNVGLDLQSKEKISGKHKEILECAEAKKFRFGAFKTLLNVSNGLVMDGLSLSAFACIGYLLVKGEITIGTAVATLGYIESFIYPIRYILTDINALHAVKEVMAELEAYLQEEDLQNMQSSPVTKLPVQNITLENVSVQRGDFALKDFSFIFEQGKSYAIIGESGAGKSTLLKLLQGEILPDTGKVLVNGEDYAPYHDLLALENFASIDQHPHVFADNYTNNVSNFGAYPTGEALLALEKVLPQDMMERIKAAQGTDLSGGEQQVLALLKAGLSGKAVHIYDEVSAAIDNKNLEAVQNFIDNNKAVRLRIEITHDTSPANLARFDVVLSLQEGRLVGVESRQ